MEAEFLYNPANTGSHCHCSSLLETQSGDLLVVWYAYPEKETVDGTLALARRPRNRNWTPSKRIDVDLPYSLGNPVLYQEPGGRIGILFVILKGPYWNDAVMEGIFSEDDGHTWSRPIPLRQGKGMMVRHPPLSLDNRRLLLPAYDEKTQQSILLASDAPYGQWRETQRFDGLHLIQACLIRGPGSGLSLFFRPCDEPRKIWRSHSTDDGGKWSTPLRTTLPNPLSGISAFAIKNHIGVVYNHTEEHQRHPLSLSLTADGGTSWGKPWHFETIDSEVSYPSFITGRNGTVHGAYTYNRRFIKYVSMTEDEIFSPHE